MIINIAVITQVRKWLDPVATFRHDLLRHRDKVVSVGQSGVRYGFGDTEVMFWYFSSDHLDMLQGHRFQGLVYLSETLYGEDAEFVASRIDYSKVKRLKESGLAVIEEPVKYAWTHKALVDVFDEILLPYLEKEGVA